MAVLRRRDLRRWVFVECCGAKINRGAVMSFKKWFESEEEKGFVIGDDGDYKYMYCDLQEAYEAGQRDMRERCIDIVNKVGGIDISAHPSSYFYEIRAIKLESEQ
jgi:hypothetical protein